MKKLLGYGIKGGLVLAVLAVLAFGTNTVSYLSTLLGLTRKAITESFSLEFQLQRARDLSDGIVRDLDTLVREYSAQELSTEELESRVARLQGSNELPQLREKVVAMKGLLVSSSGGEIAYEGASLARRDVEDRLRTAFSQYRTRRELLAYQTAALGAKKKALATLKTRISALRSEKSRLDLETERIAAMVQCVRASGTTPGADIADKSVQVNDIISTVEAQVRLIQRTEDNKAKLLPIASQDTAIQPVEQIVATVSAYLEKEDQPTKGR